MTPTLLIIGLLILAGAVAVLIRAMDRIERLIRTDQAAHRQELAGQMTNLTKSSEDRLDKLRQTVETQLRSLQEDNSKKLEQMRVTVDEKLHATLEQRLGSSFKLVSDRLEEVHKGLGEMKTLATGVGDLKKVLTNVKTRGMWGEVQLENLLQELLTPEQYDKNVATKPGSHDRVEFAIKFPGSEKDHRQIVWLPIDAKFPQDTYEQLLAAQERADLVAIDEASKQLEVRVKAEAKTIQEKYLSPPATTDFGILFVPIESLYAEILRKPGLFQFIQREYRVTITGPTTLSAILNSLQMGFRTLAIEKHSSQVWQLLGTIKQEFGKFGDLLDKTHKKIQEAGNVIEDASRKSRTIERNLNKVQTIESPLTDVPLIDEMLQ